jgi:hypothetical protein
MNTNLEALTQKIYAAFADVPWLYEVPAENLTPADALEVIEEIFLISDSDKHYELPRIMSVTITEAKPPLLKKLLCRLIEFLDADFYDPDETNDFLKKRNFEMFSNYSLSQSSAILSWLKYVEENFATSIHEEELNSAIKYWGDRVNIS